MRAGDRKNPFKSFINCYAIIRAYLDWNRLPVIIWLIKCETRADITELPCMSMDLQYPIVFVSIW